MSGHVHNHYVYKYLKVVMWMWNEVQVNIPEDIAGALKNICNTWVGHRSTEVDVERGPS